MRLRNRKQGLAGVLKLKASSTRANRDSFQDVAEARVVFPPKLGKVKPVIKKRTEINENNNVEYADVHRIDVIADSDSEGTFLDGVPAVGAHKDLLVNMQFEEDYESACGD